MQGLRLRQRGVLTMCGNILPAGLLLLTVRTAVPLPKLIELLHTVLDCIQGSLLCIELL